MESACWHEAHWRPAQICCFCACPCPLVSRDMRTTCSHILVQRCAARSLSLCSRLAGRLHMMNCTDVEISILLPSHFQEHEGHRQTMCLHLMFHKACPLRLVIILTLLGACNAHLVFVETGGRFRAFRKLTLRTPTAFFMASIAALISAIPDSTAAPAQRQWEAEQKEECRKEVSTRFLWPRFLLFESSTAWAGRAAMTENVSNIQLFRFISNCPTPLSREAKESSRWWGERREGLNTKLGASGRIYKQSRKKEINQRPKTLATSRKPASCSEILCVKDLEAVHSGNALSAAS